MDNRLEAIKLPFHLYKASDGYVYLCNAERLAIMCVVNRALKQPVRFAQAVITLINNHQDEFKSIYNDMHDSPEGRGKLNYFTTR